MSENNCQKTYTIEDEVCIMGFQCELPENHQGQHQTTYPGLDGEVAIPIKWSDTDETQKTEFYRNQIKL
jgi:hypothetical protein